MFDKKKIMSLAAAVLFLPALNGCLIEVEYDNMATHDPVESQTDSSYERDEHSHARPNQVRSRHIHLDWNIDFESSILSGTATHTLVRQPNFPQAPLIVDVKALKIHGVRGGAGTVDQDLIWQIEKGDDVLGDALRIELAPGIDTVEISYQTTGAGSGLQWLNKEQTSSKKAPFLFSQSQAIHARTWIPCQDSPGIRLTYSARVRCRPDLDVVMSAERQEAKDGVFRFQMRHPIPSYLIALAAGELEFRSMGPRTGVWAEPAVVEAAAWEFADTEQMIDVIEGLYGPYRWGRYDILVLPPSFPFGGMENPLLTFATPTVLAKDRSLTSLIAHELAHSWSGNLVTNATWRDFWLNEGFTVYVEQRVVEELYGKERADMEIMLAMDDLDEEMAGMAPEDQILHVDLKGRDPDEGFTGVPYDKGAAFLRLIENTMGRKNIDLFVRHWFDSHAFQSRTTADFRSALETALSDVENSIDLESWIEGPGLPSDAPRPKSEAFSRIDTSVAAWWAGEMKLDAMPTESWTTQEWLHFLGRQKEAVSKASMIALDEAFHLTAKQNSEIACAWLLLATEANYTPAWPRLREFLTSQGRRKFLKPLYSEMNKDVSLRAMAKEIYKTARPLYHAISTATIDEILGR